MKTLLNCFDNFVLHFVCLYPLCPPTILFSLTVILPTVRHITKKWHFLTTATKKRKQKLKHKNNKEEIVKYNTKQEEKKGENQAKKGLK